MPKLVDQPTLHSSVSMVLAHASNHIQQCSDPAFGSLPPELADDLRRQLVSLTALVDDWERVKAVPAYLLRDEDDEDDEVCPEFWSN